MRCLKIFNKKETGESDYGKQISRDQPEVDSGDDFISGFMQHQT